MSAYLHSYKESAVLARVEALWRTGLAVASQPAWSLGAAAPAGHALAPARTILHIGDEPGADTEPPYGLIFQRGDAVQVDDLCGALWEVPLGVMLALDRRSSAKAADYAAELTALFTGDFTDAGGFTPQVNWSTSTLRVDYVLSEMETATEEKEGDSIAEVHFSIRCRFVKP